jgi:hypothetical protein
MSVTEIKEGDEVILDGDNSSSSKIVVLWVGKYQARVSINGYITNVKKTRLSKRGTRHN